MLMLDYGDELGTCDEAAMPPSASIVHLVSSDN